MNLYTPDERHAWFHLYVTRWPARSASKAMTYKIKILSHSRTQTHNPDIWRFDALPTELTGLNNSCAF